MVFLLGSALNGQGTSININLPEGLDIDEIKEIIDYIDGKQSKRMMKNATIAAVSFPAALAIQWQAESKGLSPPIIHIIFEAISKWQNLGSVFSSAVSNAINGIKLEDGSHSKNVLDHTTLGGYIRQIQRVF